ncbi:MAG TPA: hypothetical protein VFA47_01395, partial [Candidatus Manganitrophaceae bacterium]|nr:hypothetical protein [Candidatus Manganitrophaceae bacterium]
MGRSSLLTSEKVFEEAGIEEAKEKPVWVQILRVRHHSPLIFYTVVFLLLLHFIAAAVMPLFVPDGMYLSLYLG